MKSLHETGESIRRGVMGDAFVDRAHAQATDFSQPLQDFVNDHAWGRSGHAPNFLVTQEV